MESGQEDVQRGGISGLSAVLASGWLLTWVVLYSSALPVKLLLKTAASGGNRHRHFHSYNRVRLELEADCRPLRTAFHCWEPQAPLPCQPVRWARLHISAACVSHYAAQPDLLAHRNEFRHHVLQYSVLGGVLVEAGKRYSATGKLTGQRTAIMNSARWWPALSAATWPEGRSALPRAWVQC